MPAEKVFTKQSPATPVFAWPLAALLLVLVFYALLRALATPTDGAVAGGFSHDSAYLSIVAEQVRIGHGLVNPAHWLLPLNPEKLPMPYHNANPAYPLLMAGFASVLGLDVVRCGFLISALASVLLAVAIFALVEHFVQSWRFAAVSAVVVALFPANWIDSLSMLPDAFCTALSLCAIAVAVRGRGAGAAVCIGVLLGFAWLARSSALLTVPPLLWWLFRTRPRAEAAKAAACLLAVFALVISPWLLHTYRVWGSPFRSDAGLYLMQEYYARACGGSVDCFWRSLDMPPSLGQVLKTQPREFFSFYFQHLPWLFYLMLAYVSGWNKFLAALYLLLTAAGFLRWRSFYRTPQFEAGAMLLLLTLAFLGVRARSFEQRYLGPALVLWVIWMLLPLRFYWMNFRLPDFRLVGFALALIAAACAVLIVSQDVREFRFRSRSMPELVAWRQDCRALSRITAGGRILIPLPYFYTWFTGDTALSPPCAPKNRTLAFMSRYAANYLALPTPQLDTYYSNALQTLTPEFQPLQQLGSYTLFKVTPRVDQ